MREMEGYLFPDDRLSAGKEDFAGARAKKMRPGTNRGLLVEKTDKNSETNEQMMQDFVFNGGSDPFDALHDDLVISVLSKLSSSAESRLDFINVLMTCKRLKGLAMHPMVLSVASPSCYTVRATNWSESAHRFINLCVEAGNVEASYYLGMIHFYCLNDRSVGLKLIAKAAIAPYPPAIYSLALIQFNGSGRTNEEKQLRSGIVLCIRAAAYGHIDALHEFGHCLQDGYGISQNVAEGRRFLSSAGLRLKSSIPNSAPYTRLNLPSNGGDVGSVSRLSAANKFMVEWFEVRWGRRGEDSAGLRLCCEANCGRPEMRWQEFRRCAACARACYCSRVCQARDWRLRHKAECPPADDDEDDDGEDDDDDDAEAVREDGDTEL